jgi:NAD(P)-dependent dehydrogenase (short-subunit alcohol dehydrogenase family)
MPRMWRRYNNARDVIETRRRSIEACRIGLGGNGSQVIVSASIILTGSVVWHKGMPIYGSYAATKAALRSYARTWAVEFAERGIRANIISPGPIETPSFDAQFLTKEASDALGEVQGECPSC